MTPGCSSAAEASRPTMRACANGERRIAACPAFRAGSMSSMKRPSPRSSVSSSSRGTAFPTQVSRSVATPMRLRRAEDLADDPVRGLDRSLLPARSGPVVRVLAGEEDGPSERRPDQRDQRLALVADRRAGDAPRPRIVRPVRRPCRTCASPGCPSPSPSSGRTRRGPRPSSSPRGWRSPLRIAHDDDRLHPAGRPRRRGTSSGAGR